MAEQLSPAQISMWFRERAKLFNKIADTVDDTFRFVPAAALNGTASHPTFPGMAVVTKDEVRKALAKKSMRVADLAAEFKVERREIQDIVNDEEIFAIGRMGWISLKDE